MIRSCFFLAALLNVFSLYGQVVNLTAVLETNKITVGSSTLLHVYAQVIPERRTDADQIVLWYLDLENADPNVAKLGLGSLSKPFSDKDPRTSSPGQLDGANLRGIYDSMFNLPGAGVSNRVELFQIPITGVTTGKTTLTVRPGSGVPNLSSDFLVAPQGDGDPLSGGIYSTNALTLLTVIPGTNVIPPDIKLRISKTNGPPRVLITFNPTAGINYAIESRDSVSSATSWIVLPGAPHNSGSFVDTNNLSKRFYRVRTTP